MADEDRTPPRAVTLLNELDVAPYTFDFFQAVRLLDCDYPDKPPTGQSTRTADDPLRFGQEASMAFAPATLYAVERHEKPPRLIQRFFGLLGPQGPLPLHITEYVRDRLRNHGDSTFLRFLDVFHHRMITLFYRAWARVQPTVSFDHPRSDRFSNYIASLFGHGMRAFRERDALPDLPKHHFAGMLSCQTRHVDGLLAILRGYFQLPVRIEEFVGQWIELPPGSQCLLGTPAAKLGVTTSVGSHVWDCQQKFRIIFGPLTLEEYYRMLPGVSKKSAAREDRPSGASTSDLTLENVSSNASLNRLVAAVRSYVGDELQWDVQLILRREETPSLSMGGAGQLGWSSWTNSEPMQRDPDDLVLDAMQVLKQFEAGAIHS
jgi:type VI secretion system protein ImpH